MEECRRLEEYAIFIATVREYAADKKRSLGTAITLAIDACIEKGILLDILTVERAEVFMYILESFDKELYERDLKQNAYDDGLQAGIEVGENNKLISQIKIKLEKGKSVDQIAEELEETVESIEKLISSMEK